MWIIGVDSTWPIVENVPEVSWCVVNCSTTSESFWQPICWRTNRQKQLHLSIILCLELKLQLEYGCNCNVPDKCRTDKSRHHFGLLGALILHSLLASNNHTNVHARSNNSAGAAMWLRRTIIIIPIYSMRRRVDAAQISREKHTNIRTLELWNRQPKHTKHTQTLSAHAKHSVRSLIYFPLLLLRCDGGGGGCRRRWRSRSRIRCRRATNSIKCAYAHVRFLVFVCVCVFVHGTASSTAAFNVRINTLMPNATERVRHHEWNMLWMPSSFWSSTRTYWII